MRTKRQRWRMLSLRHRPSLRGTSERRLQSKPLSRSNGLAQACQALPTQRTATCTRTRLTSHLAQFPLTLRRRPSEAERLVQMPAINLVCLPATCQLLDSRQDVSSRARLCLTRFANRLAARPPLARWKWLWATLWRCKMAMVNRRCWQRTSSPPWASCRPCGSSAPQVLRPHPLLPALRLTFLWQGHTCCGTQRCDARAAAGLGPLHHAIGVLPVTSVGRMDPLAASCTGPMVLNDMICSICSAQQQCDSQAQRRCSCGACCGARPPCWAMPPPITSCSSLTSWSPGAAALLLRRARCCSPGKSD